MRKKLSATQNGATLDDARIAEICRAETVRANAAARPAKAAAETRRHRALGAEQRAAKAVRTAQADARRKVEREALDWERMQRRGKRRREAEELERAGQTRIVVAWRPGREPHVAFACSPALVRKVAAEIGGREPKGTARRSGDARAAERMILGEEVGDDWDADREPSEVFADERARRGFLLRSELFETRSDTAGPVHQELARALLNREEYGAVSYQVACLAYGDDTFDLTIPAHFEAVAHA